MNSASLKTFLKSYKPVLVLPLLWLFIQFLSYFPKAVERWYSLGIYPWISGLLRHFLGVIPFSVGDIVYTILILVLLGSLYRWTKITKSLRRSYIMGAVRSVTVIYFLFYGLWAFNYHREKIQEKMELSKTYDSHELFVFTLRLIEHTNGLHLDLTHDKDQPVNLPYSQSELIQKTYDAYGILGQQNPLWKLEGKSVKPSLYSVPLSYMGFAGYLNPFTNEAQFNQEIPKYSQGATICHEMAHQLGYASESEANFIGFLAASQSQDPYLEYSGYTMALRYCLRNVSRYDDALFQKMLGKINPGILKNFEESRKHSEQYSTFIEDIFTNIYDGFLRFNSQTDGMEGYNRFVELLVNFYENRNFEPLESSDFTD